jgi:DNA-directed RNA polymerase subunit RPC12/RpoP
MPAELQPVAETRSDDATTRCRNCGSYVTSAFARVFGDNDNQVYACLECSTMRALRTGSGVVHE